MTKIFEPFAGGNIGELASTDQFSVSAGSYQDSASEETEEAGVRRGVIKTWRMERPRPDMAEEAPQSEHGSRTTRRTIAAVGIVVLLALVAISIKWALDRTSSHAAAVAPTKILSGGFLQPGRSIYSANGHFRLTMQTDGNLVDYEIKRRIPQWESGTSGNFGSYAIVQPDGNFVVYPEGRSAPAPGQPTPALWFSGSYGHPGAYGVLETDGSTVVRDKGSGTILWRSPT